MKSLLWINISLTLLALEIAIVPEAVRFYIIYVLQQNGVPGIEMTFFKGDSNELAGSALRRF